MTTDLAIALGNLPAEPNSFVGRERDLAELALLLSEVRALTLCGPGGIGKTRLALRLAGQLGPGFPDGAWLAELADVSQPDLVAPQIAVVLGIRAEPDRPLADTLSDALRPRRLLLVLDTCEHVVEASAALVQRLLAGCPGLRVVVTSREPLRVRGETVWRVPPLELPAGPPGAAYADITRHEAVRLFAERAAAVRPGFALGPQNAEAIVRVVRTLDGMPLAIELAAARVRALSVDQIADRLGDRFGLLASGDRTAPPRQQTLRAAVDWSYELLTEPEQALLRRLSVFSGWNLEMAEQVCADDRIPAGQVLALLAALIDKSLVALEGELAGDARYRLLDTIRQYAHERLAARAEAPGIRQRHRDFMLRLAEQSAAKAFRAKDPPWPERVATYHRMAAERANFLVALSACADRGETEVGLRLCSALHIQWVVSGDLAEGVSWFDRFLAADSAASATVRARALMHRAGLAFFQQDTELARRCTEESLQLSRAAEGSGEAEGLRMLAVLSLSEGRYGEAADRVAVALEAARAGADPWNEGLALAIRAAVIARQGRLDEARTAFETALDVLRDNNGWGVAQVLYGLGSLARARGEHEAALRHFKAALALYREIDARPEIARCLAGIGGVALAQADLGLALSSLTECLQLSLAAGQRLAIARGLDAFAVLAVAQDDPARAIRLHGAALALREAVAGLPSAAVSPQVRRAVQAARSLLGASAAAALLEQGKAMNAYQAARLAVEPPGEPASDVVLATDQAGQDLAGCQPPNGTGPAEVLTGRELEIATLIARGLSNRSIAGELAIRPATAARHVANILTKLGFSSRVQVAAWMVERKAPGPD